MKLHVRHEFPFTPEQFWACFDDPAWNEEERRAAGQHNTRLESRTEGDVEIVRERIQTSIQLPSMVSSRLGTDRLGFDIIHRIDRKNSRLTWEVIPPAMQDKITARGTMVVRAIPGGCEQVVEGDVIVNVPLVGGKIEQGVVDGIRKSHEETAARRLAWMKRHYA